MGRPKGEAVGGMKPGRCGIDPARKRDRSEFLPRSAPAYPPGKLPGVPGVIEPGLNGLVDGVGREVFDTSTDCGFSAPSPAAGENLDGSVPALVLPRVRGAVVVFAASGVGCKKSGKPSALGDSGIVSRRGVLLPLVGGPQA